MAQNQTPAAVVHSIIDLGHNLGLGVVGEGVETQAALAKLREHGCDIVQGFIFAPAMFEDEFLAWTASSRGSAQSVA